MTPETLTVIKANELTPDPIEHDEFIVDPVFRDLLESAGDLPDDLLDAQIIATGGPEVPLVVWKETRILVDGHRRHEICVRHGFNFEIKEMSFKDRDDAVTWMRENQLSRRNVSDNARAAMTKTHIEYVKNQAMENGGRKVSTQEAIETVANSTGRTPRQVKSDSLAASATQNLSCDWQVAIASKQFDVPKRFITKMAKMTRDDQDLILAACIKENSLGPLRTRFMPKPKEETKKGDQLTATASAPIGSEKTAKKVSVTDYTDEEEDEGEDLETVVVQGPAQETPEQKVDRAKRIDRIVDTIVQEAGALCRLTDKLFSDEGFGEDSRRSSFKLRVDQAHRELAMTIDEAKETL